VASPDRIDDLVVLGRAAPEPIADGRHTVCLGGYSETVGYVRLYPTKENMSECRRWNIVSVPVESAAPDDTREESYKIAGSKRDWETLHTKIEQVDRLSKTEQIELVDRLAGDCPAELNEQHKSLGIAKPKVIHDHYIEQRDDPTYQVTISGERQTGKKQFPYQLYIEYECEVCQNKTPHRQHCIEWGVYNYFRRYDEPDGVIDALGLTDEQREHYFFVGNLNHQRGAYIIISDLRFKHEDLRDAGIRLDSQASLDYF
jgi:hypothetical protein